jgi:hypothetical protein
MRSSDQPLGFVTTVRAIVSSTPFFTLACLTAAIVLLMAQPVPEMDEPEGASMSATTVAVDEVGVEAASAPLANAAAGITP